jgi:hypothetical protein
MRPQRERPPAMPEKESGSKPLVDCIVESLLEENFPRTHLNGSDDGAMYTPAAQRDCDGSADVLVWTYASTLQSFKPGWDIEKEYCVGEENEFQSVRGVRFRTREFPPVTDADGDNTAAVQVTWAMDTQRGREPDQVIPGGFLGLLQLQELAKQLPVGPIPWENCYSTHNPVPKAILSWADLCFNLDMVHDALIHRLLSGLMELHCELDPDDADSDDDSDEFELEDEDDSPRRLEDDGDSGNYYEKVDHDKKERQETRDRQNYSRPNERDEPARVNSGKQKESNSLMLLDLLDRAIDLVSEDRRNRRKVRREQRRSRRGSDAHSSRSLGRERNANPIKSMLRLLSLPSSPSRRPRSLDQAASAREELEERARLDRPDDFLAPYAYSQHDPLLINIQQQAGNMAKTVRKIIPTLEYCCERIGCALVAYNNMRRDIALANGRGITAEFPVHICSLEGIGMVLEEASTSFQRHQDYFRRQLAILEEADRFVPGWELGEPRSEAGGQVFIPGAIDALHELLKFYKELERAVKAADTWVGDGAMAMDGMRLKFLLWKARRTSRLED